MQIARCSVLVLSSKLGCRCSQLRRAPGRFQALYLCPRDPQAAALRQGMALQPGPATDQMLCDPEQVTFPLWAPVSSPVNGGKDDLTSSACGESWVHGGKGQYTSALSPPLL